MTTDPAPNFPDHFSRVASTYAQFRPSYPDALFDWIASTARSTARAWDCAAGNGQATLALAERFASVIATDASASQVEHAPMHPRVSWRVAPAEASGLDGASIDVVTIAQALHWFDLDRFWREVRRVVVPGGLVVAWTYGNHSVSDSAIDAATRRFSEVTVGPYWPPERAHINAHYATLSFPFDRVAVPQFDLSMNWSLDQVLGYMRSWSSTSVYIAEHRSDPVDQLEMELAPLWGDGVRTVHWPLTVLAGMVAVPSP